MKLQIMSPAADRVDFQTPPAPRLTSLEGKTIGLYHNMTGGSDIAVERVAEHLSQRYPNIKFERYGGDLRPGRPALSRGNHIDAEEATRIATEVDAVIGATAHWGGCTSWLAHDMVAIEKAGIPALGIVARSFIKAWQSCVDGWGQPSTAFVTIPHATTGQQADFICNMVDEQIDAIIRGLTTPPDSERMTRDTQNGSKTTEIFTVEMDETPAGLDAVNRFLAERDWSDGIPVVPPTLAAVEQMLKGTKRQPQDVLMVMEPGFGLATVEKIAINAVMAGCRTKHLPVLLAAIDCLAQPEMNHRDMQVSGHTEAPIILVNGPVAETAGINSGTTAMGPGVINSANTAIGRALRLCLINIGYCKAGAGDPNYIGLPTKFGMCIAENEAASPWPPYHVDRGFKRHESAVTVVTVTGPTTIIDSSSKTHEDTLDNIASMMFYRNAGAGAWLRGWQSAQVGHSNERVSYPGPYHPIILSPSRAVIMAEAGMSKQDAQAWLHRNCRVSLKSVLGTRGMPMDDRGKWLTHPEFQHLENDPDATIPALESPEQYLLFVSGGSTHYANFFYGTYGIATRPVAV